MLKRKVLCALSASVLVRLPNLILPIVAVRVFNWSEYAIFTVAFATASAASAFLGEAIAIVISRESCRARHGVQGDHSLAALFRAAVFVSFLVILAGVCVYWFVFALPRENVLLLVLGTILLVPAYILPMPTAALANAYGHSGSSVFASVIGVPLSTTVSLIVGVVFGVIYFFAAYFVCVILTNLYVYVKIVPLDFICKIRGTWNSLYEYGRVLIVIILPLLLGGPVHGFCMFILGSQEGGVSELAAFIAYYPWSIVTSVFAVMAINYVIQLIVEVKRENNKEKLRRLLKFLLICNLLASVIVGACLWYGRGFIFALYGAGFAKNDALLGWIIFCGVGAACVSITSQIIIGVGNSRGLLAGAIIHALLYIGSTYLLVEKLFEGAIGLARALSFSLTILALFYLVLIGFFVLKRQ